MDVMMLLDLKMPSETFVCVNVSSKNVILACSTLPVIFATPAQNIRT